MQKLSFEITKLQASPWYALVLLLLALSSIVMLTYEIFVAPDISVFKLIANIDLTIALIFMTDFFLGMFFNQQYTKKQYMKTNWLDFISSIPVTFELAQALRILRVFRAIKVISTGLDVWFTGKKYRLNQKIK